MKDILKALADSFRYKATQTDSYTLESPYISMAVDLESIVEWLVEEVEEDQ